MELALPSELSVDELRSIAEVASMIRHRRSPVSFGGVTLEAPDEVQRGLEAVPRPPLVVALPVRHTLVGGADLQANPVLDFDRDPPEQPA